MSPTPLHSDIMVKSYQQKIERNCWPCVGVSPPGIWAESSYLPGTTRFHDHCEDPITGP